MAKQRQQATQLAGKTENGQPITKGEIGEVHLNTTEQGKARDIVAKTVKNLKEFKNLTEFQGVDS